MYVNKIDYVSNKKSRVSEPCDDKFGFPLKGENILVH